jgi:hypothetical protein
MQQCNVIFYERLKKKLLTDTNKRLFAFPDGLLLSRRQQMENRFPTQFRITNGG